MLFPGNCQKKVLLKIGSSEKTEKQFTNVDKIIYYRVIFLGKKEGTAKSFDQTFFKFDGANP